MGEKATRNQIGKLTEFMLQHPTLANGTLIKTSQGRIANSLLWEKLMKQLNSMGPPVKSTGDWRRMWTLRKHRIRQKLAKSRAIEAETDGHFEKRVMLREAEEKIVEACGLDIEPVVRSSSPPTDVDENISMVINESLNKTEEMLEDVKSINTNERSRVGVFMEFIAEEIGKIYDEELLEEAKYEILDVIRNFIKRDREERKLKLKSSKSYSNHSSEYRISKNSPVCEVNYNTSSSNRYSSPTVFENVLIADDTTDIDSHFSKPYGTTVLRPRDPIASRKLQLSGSED